MTSKSIPFDLQELLTELEFLGQITQGNKPCMNNMTLVDSSSWIGAIKRYITGESRDGIIREIRNIVDKAIESIQTHKDKEFLSLIINKLGQARQGIETLKVTYRSDPKMISRISVILANIDLQLQKNRNFLKGYSFLSNDNMNFNNNNNNDNNINNINNNGTRNLSPIIYDRYFNINEEKSDEQKTNDIKSDNVKLNNIKSDDIKLNNIKSTNIKSNNTKPGNTKLNNIKSDDIKLNNSKSDDIKLNNSKSDDIKLNNSKSDDIKLNNSRSDDIKLNNSKLDDIKLNNSKLDDIKLNNSKSDDTKPNNIKLDDIKSDEMKSNDIKLDEIKSSDIKYPTEEISENDKIRRYDKIR